MKVEVDVLDFVEIERRLDSATEDIRKLRDEAATAVDLADERDLVVGSVNAVAGKARGLVDVCREAIDALAALDLSSLD